MKKLFSPNKLNKYLPNYPLLNNVSSNLKPL